MDEDAAPSARRFGAEVRRLRECAGLSQTKLALKIPVSQSTMSDVERGKFRVKKDIAERIDRTLTGEGRVVAAWEAQYESYDPPEWYRKLPLMEQRASEIQEYSPLLVPGLLQNRNYARSSIRASQRVASVQEIEGKVRERLERQQVLQGDDPPYFLAVIDETVLYRRLGDRDVALGQIEHLLEVSGWSRVEVLVIPADTLDHPGLDGGFKLLRVPDAGMVVYHETRAGGGVVITPETVEEHVSLMGTLRGVALPPEQSRLLLDRIRGEIR